jgi:hypothetical protein
LDARIWAVLRQASRHLSEAGVSHASFDEDSEIRHSLNLVCEQPPFPPERHQPSPSTPDLPVVDAIRLATALGMRTTAPNAAVRYDRQADVAQLAEHRFCKPGVAGSIPAVGSL